MSQMLHSGTKKPVVRCGEGICGAPRVDDLADRVGIGCSRTLGKGGVMRDLIPVLEGNRNLSSCWHGGVHIKCTLLGDSVESSLIRPAGVSVGVALPS
jgi:hypothetical protein